MRTVAAPERVIGPVATPDRPPAPVRERRLRRRRTSRRERQVINLVSAASAVAAGLLVPAPMTDLWFIDVLYTVAFTWFCCRVASRARRWCWPLLAGAAVVCASSWILLGLSVVAVAASTSALGPVRHRAIGAFTGAVAAGSLLTVELVDPGAAKAALAVLVLAPAVASARSVLPHEQVRRVQRASAIAAGVVVVVVLSAAASLWAAAGDLRVGVTASDTGLAAITDGEVAIAGGALEEASAHLGRATRWLTSPLAQPARLVPVVGQHVRAAQVTAAEAAALATAGAQVAAVADTERLAPHDSRVDLAGFDPVVAPLERLHLTAERAHRTLASVDSAWLLPIAAEPLATLRDGLGDVADASEVAAAAARSLPALLGRDGPRHYLVLLTTPAEARGLGGFVGSWVRLRADGGRVELVETGRAADINALLADHEVVLDAPTDFVDRWARFDPVSHFQDITLSPDFPTVAAVTVGLFDQTDQPVDGVFAVDPHGLEALLAFTGPVDVPGRDVRLTERNTVDYLLRDQYVGDDEEVREAVLAEAAGAAFSQLLGADFPSLAAVRDILGPVIAERRLMAWVTDDQEFFTLTGLDGAFPRPEDVTSDFLAVTHQNSAQNKIDPYLERAIDYRGSVDPRTGAIEVTARVTLTNNAPPDGLPESVIGSNDQGLAPGTNRLYLSLYTPHQFVASRLDGRRHLVETNGELGWRTMSTRLELPPGSSTVFEIDLVGTVDPAVPYHVTIPAQPLINDDVVTVEIRHGEGPDEFS